MRKEIIINDEILLKTLNIQGTDSFNDLIKGITKHVYEKIKLDGIFDIKKWLEALLESEVFLSTTKKRHRDHLLHACRIAIFGEKILHLEIKYNDNTIKILDLVRELFVRNSEVQEILHSYEIDCRDKERIDYLILQAWYVSALFHDIGYIYESFIESWNNVKQFLGSYHFNDFHLNIESAINKLQSNIVVSGVHGFANKSLL